MTAEAKRPFGINVRQHKREVRNTFSNRVEDTRNGVSNHESNGESNHGSNATLNRQNMIMIITYT